MKNTQGRTNLLRALFVLFSLLYLPYGFFLLGLVVEKWEVFFRDRGENNHRKAKAKGENARRAKIERAEKTTDGGTKEEEKERRERHRERSTRQGALTNLLNTPSGLLFSKSSRCLFCMPSLFFLLKECTQMMSNKQKQNTTIKQKWMYVWMYVWMYGCMYGCMDVYGCMYG